MAHKYVPGIGHVNDDSQTVYEPRIRMWVSPSGFGWDGQQYRHVSEFPGPVQNVLQEAMMRARQYVSPGPQQPSPLPGPIEARPPVTPFPEEDGIDVGGVDGGGSYGGIGGGLDGARAPLGGLAAIASFLRGGGSFGGNTVPTGQPSGTIPGRSVFPQPEVGGGIAGGIDGGQTGGGGSPLAELAAMLAGMRGQG